MCSKHDGERTSNNCLLVHDLKVLHSHKNAVTALVVNIAEIYGPKTTICRYKVHEYLWMDINWVTELGAMILSMIKYLYKVIKEFPGVIKGTNLSLAGDHPFSVQEYANRKVIPEE